MTWYHLVIAGTHYVFPQSAIIQMYTNTTDGSQSVFLQLIGDVSFEITVAQALKIVGTLPAPL